MAKLPALPFVRSSITQGLSASAALREYRATAGEQGLRGMRRQDFLRLYSEVLASNDRTQEAMDAPKDVVPSGPFPLRHTETAAPGYIQSVAIYQRTRGTDDLIQTPYMIKTARPITPQEAEQRAQWYLEQEEPDVYNRITLGVVYTGTVRLERRAR